MISSLRGTLQELNSNIATIDVGGVGYEVICSSGCLDKFIVGEQVSVVIYTDVREDAIRLYGFVDRLEKQVFLLLTLVKGLGAKSASDIISNVNPKDLLRIIAAGDLARLQSIRGIGRKTAERIVVELRDRVAGFVMESQADRMGVDREVTGAYQDAVDALSALGFSRNEAEMAVRKVAPAAMSSAGEIVKEALKFV